MRIGFYQFRDVMSQTYDGSCFTNEGLFVLFNYLNRLDPDYLLCPIDLCCIYRELSFDEFYDIYAPKIVGGDIKQSILDFINYKSLVIGQTQNTVIFLFF